MAVTLLLMMSPTHIGLLGSGAPLLPTQPPDNVPLLRQQSMAQEPGFLSFMWATQLEFLILSLALSNPRYCGHLGQ